MTWVKKPSKVYTFKVTLDGSDPPIWRSVQVTDAMTVSDLHYTLQIAMGWTESHMHEFVIDEQRYARLSPHDDHGLDGPPEEERETLLGDVIHNERQTFQYIYDFGDDWMHDVVVEGISTPEPGKYYPTCLNGEQACPPEDCGGIDRYNEILEILDDPDHEEYEEYREWLPEDFSPDEFDLDTVNGMLENIDEWLSYDDTDS